MGQETGLVSAGAETMTADWHLVLARDGTVLAAAGGAASEWVGRRLDDCADAPEHVKAAARALVERPLEAAPMVTSTTAAGIAGSATPHLTVVESIPIRRAATDVRTLLPSALEALEQQANACDVTLSISVRDEVPPTVSLDAEKVAWIVTALVGNSLRHVRHGSRLMPGGSIAVRVTYEAASRTVGIEVQDDGRGIPADRLPLLFRAAADRARVGLGLLMVQDVVIAHGGRIDVESDSSTVRHGTTVRLTLPSS